MVGVCAWACVRVRVRVRGGVLLAWGHVVRRAAACEFKGPWLGDRCHGVVWRPRVEILGLPGRGRSTVASSGGRGCGRWVLWCGWGREWREEGGDPIAREAQISKKET